MVYGIAQRCETVFCNGRLTIAYNGHVLSCAGRVCKNGGVITVTHETRMEGRGETGDARDAGETLFRVYSFIFSGDFYC